MTTSGRTTTRPSASLALDRTRRMMLEHRVMSLSMLEMKISEAGPYNQRAEPPLLTNARDALIAEGTIYPLEAHQTPGTGTTTLYAHHTFNIANPSPRDHARLERVLAGYRTWLPAAMRRRSCGAVLELAIHAAALASSPPITVLGEPGKHHKTILSDVHITIASTICTRGYTATVRPPLSITEPIKRQEMAAYGLQGQRLADYGLDHLVALELGGAPADVANLWPEPWTGDGNAHMKDAVENFLNREVCRGTMQLVEAQRQLATDWLAVYRQNGLKPSP